MKARIVNQNGHTVLEINGKRFPFAATPNIPSALLRSIAEQAGAFVYSHTNRVYVYPTDSYVGVYNATEEATTVYLPEDGIYRDLIEGVCYNCKQGALTLSPKPLRAYIFVKE